MSDFPGYNHYRWLELYNEQTFTMKGEVIDWLKSFESCVNKVDYEGGKTLFENNCCCFGSVSEMMIGIDELVENQWTKVWPNILDFKFQFDRLHMAMDNNEAIAMCMLPWTSLGFNESGQKFIRPGRVTIFLRRSTEGCLLAYHTHYSITPGTRTAYLN
jgi:hypothetical protein